jgi:multiple sugar transport system permease protein
VSDSLFILGVLLTYVAAGSAIVLGGLAVRSRNMGILAAIIVVLLSAILAAPRLTTDTGGVMAAGSGTALICFAIIYLVGLRPRMTWQDHKAGREIKRQTILHLILLTGSALFMVPFVWLVVTSLKEDEDMSRFPPVWIPQQQVKIDVDGKLVGLAWAPYKGQRVKAAVLKEMETGDRRLRVLEPAALRGEEFELPRTEVTKIKQFDPVWKNYPDALKFLPAETKKGLVFLTNTLIISLLTIVGTVLSCSLVAFSFARLKWPGRDTLFVVLLATMMIPGAVTMMPVFLINRWLGWVDTLRPLWFPSFVAASGTHPSSAFTIFLLRQFFLTIPNDLEDAAKIDGCSYFGIYWRIMLPLIKPALAAVVILKFMGSWNDFMGPLIYVSSPTRMPLAYALQLFQTARGGEPGLLMAASTMMMLPVLALFFVTQRYFIQGVTLTGIKG